MIEMMTAKLSFRQKKVGSGDVICCSELVCLRGINKIVVCIQKNKGKTKESIDPMGTNKNHNGSEKIVA